ncbi:hypothetical protein EJ08DRAFT_191644 [Tothia fuscella]|uniref:ABM domain-containing protein n=1 Tax=Tothia fuscella TaxID=1048955 RepID=A0A9P4NTQ7_9PEZI|nr:hypothetical protein EJ08DRAFT_191644 [Tothia fuscella]
MATWPVTYPDNVKEEGRLTKVFVVPLNKFDDFKKTALETHSKSARQVLQGKTIDDGNSGDALEESVLDTSSQKSEPSMVVLIDSPPNDDSTTPTDVNKSNAIAYSILAPTSYTTTPKAGYYLINVMRVKKAKQPALAAALDAYLRGVFHCGEFEPVFHHNFLSREDPEIYVNVQGWPSREAGREYWTSKIHTNFFPAVVEMLSMDGSWEVELK